MDPAPNPQGGTGLAQTASALKPRSPDALLTALRAPRESAAKANPGILTAGYQAAHREEALRNSLPQARQSDRLGPEDADFSNLMAEDSLEGAQGGQGEVSLQDNSSVPVDHSREFDEEQGSDHEMGGQ